MCACMYGLEHIVILINAHLKLSDVKRLPERLDCMLFRVRFEEERKELQDVSCWLWGGGGLWVVMIFLAINMNH